MSGELGAAGSGLPWYRHFWPWFIVGLLATSVVAGITTVYIAFENQDSLVRGDYYKDGLAINRRLERERLAAELGLSASLSLDAGSGRLRVLLSGPASAAPETLVLSLSHATQASRDVAFELKAAGSGVYEARVDAMPGAGRWYATLEPLAEDAEGADGVEVWRLGKTLRLPATKPVVFGATP